MKLFGSKLKKEEPRIKKPQEKLKKEDWIELALLLLGLIAALAVYYIKRDLSLALGCLAAGVLLFLASRMMLSLGKKKKEKDPEGEIVIDFLSRLLSLLISGEKFLNSYKKAGEEIKASLFKDKLLSVFQVNGKDESGKSLKEKKGKAKATETILKDAKTSAFDNGSKEKQAIGSLINLGLSSSLLPEDYFHLLSQAKSAYAEGEGGKKELADYASKLLLSVYIAFLIYFLFLTGKGL